MLSYLKNLDPMTKTLIKIGAVHAAVIVGTVVASKVLEARAQNSSD